MVDFLEGLELAELLGQDGHVVPDQIDVRMPSDLVFFGLFGLLLLDLLASHVLLARVTTVMMIFATSTCLGWLLVFLICALLGCDDFPFHGEGALTQQFVLGVGQIDANLAPIEDIEVSSARCCRAA